MVRVRPVSLERLADLSLTYQRLGLPSPAREYLLHKTPHLTLLLTELPREAGRFLRLLGVESEAPGREEFPSFLAGDRASHACTAVLAGRLEQFDRLVERLGLSEELRPLARALSDALRNLAGPPAALFLGSRRLEFGTRTHVMGILNVTPDSFSDGGRYLAPEDAVARGRALAEAGADIIDVGGASSRPGSEIVPAEVELERVVPVLRGLRACTDVPLSIDTFHAAVAREALREGASLVNDISGFRFDAAMPGVVAEAGAACCVMHIQGTPRTMQEAPSYPDLMEDVLGVVAAAVQQAEAAGVPRARILVDPGVGFGKTAGHNLFLLRRLEELRVLGLPVLVGTSRKGFLGALTGGKPAGERLLATLTSIAALAARGSVDLVRVHDVAETREVLAVADALREASEGGDLFRRTLLHPRP